MEKILRQLNSADSLTQKLVRHFIEVKLAEVEKINGRIARDLDKFGGYACLDNSAYDKLKEKYKRAHAGKRKLELLELMRVKNLGGYHHENYRTES